MFATTTTTSKAATVRGSSFKGTSVSIERRHVQCQAKKEKTIGGFRYDPGYQRWIRDARVTESFTTVTPFSGSPYTVWPVMHMALKEANLQTISPQEAEKLSKSGWIFADVRMEIDFEKQHAVKAINLPLFRFVEGEQLWDKVKKVVMSSLFMRATEREPDYPALVMSKIKKNSKIVLICSIGGTLDTYVSYRREKKMFQDPERSFGRESRSLKAAWELLEVGWDAKNIRVVDGGFQQWKYQDFPIEESE
jgi:rhodanese-related sulfurtransferase